MDPFLELALGLKAGQRVFERWANEAMRPLGLTGAQADALLVIRQAGPLSLKELGELLIAEAGHPSRLVDRLVDAGLVERREAGDDRRRVILSLTPQGRKVEKQAAEARHAIVEASAQLFGGEDVEPVLALVRKLLAFTPYAELIARRAQLYDKEADAGAVKLSSESSDAG
jgi:MarR family transcriptional regulator, organic hydroperoxide resistance regulator